jgi:plastocyanin
MQITLFSKIAGIALLVASVTHCSGGGGGGGGDPDPMGPDPAPSTVAITTATSPPPAFIPRTAELAVGGTVTWTNTSPAPNNHDLVATTSNWQLGRTLSPGASFQTTIAQAGTYGYQCTIHPGMNGTIEVR